MIRHSSEPTEDGTIVWFTNGIQKMSFFVHDDAIAPSLDDMRREFCKALYKYTIDKRKKGALAA